MYIPKAFIGSCFAGASASSHAFFSLRVSVSAVVGTFREVDLVAAFERDVWVSVEDV